ncbi:MAG: UDP-N-acetylmuramoyl-L-alanyl-D-glutamate--2,6-diaminopimelate ligase [Methylophagaceae bacterium]
MMATNNTRSITTLLVGMLFDPSVIDDVMVTGISLDSRNIQADWLFLSLATDDSLRLKNLQQALSQGAVVVLFENDQALTEDEVIMMDKAEVPAYKINNLSDKAGEIAARFYGHPSLALTVIAVTGTNGKTSVSQFIAQALESLGQSCGVIGTLGVGQVNNLQSTGMTTPDPVSLQAVLADFCSQSIKYVVIEASSHALEQGRLNSVVIDVAVLTNLSRDHLDYHQDMAEYATAKRQLFDFDSIKTAVVNSADEFGQVLTVDLLKRSDISILTYSSCIGEVTTFSASNIKSLVDGLNFTLSSDGKLANIQSSLIGRFNVDNILAASACLSAVGISFDNIIKAVQQCQAIDGRMQAYGTGQQAHIVIDFAHTPEALTQVLQSLRSHTPRNGYLWCVFGCGGDRDSGKRPQMGRNAELYADKIVLTDDNPRSEQSSTIISDILSGFEKPEKVHVQADRRLAITHAITTATAKDIILVAGKGHEQYQEIAGIKYSFNDAQVVNEVLQAANDESHSVIGAKQ